jgi:hypothetical protein
MSGSKLSRQAMTRPLWIRRNAGGLEPGADLSQSRSWLVGFKQIESTASPSTNSWMIVGGVRRSSLSQREPYDDED